MKSFILPLIMLVSWWSGSLPASSCDNQLATGGTARVLTAVDVPLSDVFELDGRSKQEILNSREALVMRHDRLLAAPYRPCRKVFGQIVSGKPWWGMAGAFVYGTGNRSLQGASEESRFILNPYLLVAASSWTTEVWDANRLTAADLDEPEFPYCWMPSSLIINPREKHLSVRYDVSRFNRLLVERWKDKLNDTEESREFSLVAYNARDFGYNYIHVSYEDSTNISSDCKPERAVEIKQYIHCGGSCGCRGGCNNMSPAQEELDHLYYEQLPALVKVKLWKRRPAKAKSTPADMSVTIELF